MKRLWLSVWPHLQHWWGMVVEFADITDRRHIFLLSAGIAFNQLLCLIPTVLLAISITSALIDQETTKNTVLEALQQFMPMNTQAALVVEGVVAEIDAVFNYSTLAGWIAGIALVWLASSLFGSMRTGLNAIFHIPTPKFFLLYKIKDLVLTVIVALLVLIATVLTPIVSLLVEWLQGTVFLNALHLESSGSAQVFSVVSTCVVFVVLYRVVPNQKLPGTIVLLSTAFAVVMWELARLAFTWYVNSATNLSLFYGSYLAVVSLALWLYYSSLVFLVAAELAQYVHMRRVEHRSPTP